VTIAGNERISRVYVPSRYDASREWPLVFNLHAADENADAQAATTGLEVTAETHGFVVVHPEAQSGLWTFEDDSDINFLSSLTSSLRAELCIDQARIFAAGMSQGGDFASYLACRTGSVTALASVGVLNYQADCPSQTPIPVVAFVGRSDPIYLIDEGLNEAAPFSGPPAARPGPLVDEADAWAEANGCKSDPTVIEDSGGVDRVEYDCPTGREVIYYLHDGGHTWPGSRPAPGLEVFLGPGFPDLPANEIIWEFFAGAGASG